MRTRSLPAALLLLALAAAGRPAPCQSPGSDAGLDELMSLLAKRQHGHVQFVEREFLAVLDHPLQSSGEMRYDAPDRLEKRTIAPRPETLILKGSILTVDRGKSHRVVDLHAYPQAQPFVESVRATLAGDRGALEKLFVVNFNGSLSNWTLTLVPKDSDVKRSVAAVRIDGAEDQLLAVEIRQPDGDHSLMTLQPAPAP